MGSEKKCCLCSEEFERSGCNPWPVSETGRCCDECDSKKVMPARMVKCGFSRADAEEIGKVHWDINKTFSGMSADEWFAAVNDTEDKLLGLWNPSFNNDKNK